MTRLSQCDLVYGVLKDGRPHTAAEIHQRCGFMRLNSRVAELRSRRGLDIACRHLPEAGCGPDAYEYRLLNEPPALREGAEVAGGSLSGRRPTTGHAVSPDTRAAAQTVGKGTTGPVETPLLSGASGVSTRSGSTVAAPSVDQVAQPALQREAASLPAPIPGQLTIQDAA